MAWTLFNRIRGKAPARAATVAPDLQAYLAVHGQSRTQDDWRGDSPQLHAVIDQAGLQSTPGFARKAAIEGADGTRRQPAFAHSPFTPTRPIMSEKSLIGRRKQLDRAISAVQIERAHLAIFGERGNGKTSFANVLASMAEEAGYGVVRHTCTSKPTFGELFGSVAAKIPPRFLRPVLAEQENQSFGHRTIWTVASAVTQLEDIRAGHVLIMIDEFDRLSDEDAKRDMTELLKTTSDLSVRVSFILIGVAESLDELLELHPSLQRTMVAIPLPLLQDDDISALLEKGCRDLRLALAPDARAALLLLTQGSPYFAQLLSLHSSDSAVKRGSRDLTLEDVAAAILLVLEETRHSFEPSLAGLPKADPRWPDLLFAAASAECNGFGWFTAAGASASAVQQNMALPGDLSFGLAVLASPEGGSILKRRLMPESEEYAFARVNLRNYVLMREAERRKVLTETPPVSNPEMQLFAGASAESEAVSS